jgi:alpha-D-ribose 1-methylphosphonate 5-triphosphate diphosphatase PhnM
MNIRNSASIALWAAVIFSTNVIAKDIAIYRWVDENNVVHFSQHQPKNTNYSELTTFASYKAKKKALPEQANLPSVDEQLSKYEKDKAEVAAKNKEIAEKNCKAAQINVKTLNSFDTVMITDPDGKNRALTEKEKKAQLALSKKHINMYCEQDPQIKN